MAKRVNLRWVADPDLSAAHATYVVATGAPCTDEKTEQLLVSSVTDINNRLLSSSIDMGLFWSKYFAKSLADSDISTACASALLSAGCSEMQVDQTGKTIGNRLSDARHAFTRRFPKLNEQLELRARPLRDRWDTVGPGLLREVERQVWEKSPPTGWWTSRVTALMVQPMRGGDGGFDAAGSKLWMEAMLTDVDPSVPEVLRVAWLITRMSLESYTSEIPQAGIAVDNHPATLPWALASVPFVLMAAAQLDFFSPDSLPIRRAMELWRFGDASVAETLEQWWYDFAAFPSPIPVALRNLDQMLEAGRQVAADDMPSEEA